MASTIGEVVVFGEVHVAAGDGLAQLAVADDVGGPADRAAGVGALERAGEVEGVREQEVAQQDAGLVVPAGVDRVFVAADGGFVEHIVVDERRGVDHFDHGGERDVFVAQRTDGLAGQQEQGGAESFAGEADAVADDFVGLGVVAVQLVGQPGVDAAQLAADASRRARRGFAAGRRGAGGRCSWESFRSGAANDARMASGVRPGRSAAGCRITRLTIRLYRAASVRCGRPIFLPVECVRS